jgi:hypothetical protein
MIQMRSKFTVKYLQTCSRSNSSDNGIELNLRMNQMSRALLLVVDVVSAGMTNATAEF